MIRFNFASKSFGKIRILEPISLEFEKGSITAIMGPSGIGKTTLLRMVAGLDQDDANTQQPELKIGMVFQEPHLLPWKTVLENIELAGPENGLLASLDLTEAAFFYPRQLSLGMARRVAFARAIASQPDLIILDEPFVSLDRVLVDVIQKNIIEISQISKTPVLLTTHHQDDVISLGATLMKLEGAPARLRRDASYDPK